MTTPDIQAAHDREVDEAKAEQNTLAGQLAEANRAWVAFGEAVITETTRLVRQFQSPWGRFRLRVLGLWLKVTRRA